MTDQLPYPKTHEEAVALKRQFKNMRGIERMHKLYNAAPGEKCKHCAHFFGMDYSKRYFKCKLYGFSHGPATDWRANFDACGKFERKT